MVLYLVLIYLISCLSLILILFYYVDMDGDRFVEGNTIGDMLHFSNHEDCYPFLVYTPIINTLFLLLCIILVIAERTNKLVFIKKFVLYLEKLLNTRIR